MIRTLWSLLRFLLLLNSIGRSEPGGYVGWWFDWNTNPEPSDQDEPDPAKGKDIIILSFKPR